MASLIDDKKVFNDAVNLDIDGKKSHSFSTCLMDNKSGDMLSGSWTDAEKFTIVDGYVVLRNTGSYASAAMSGFAIEDFIDMKIIPLTIFGDDAKKTKKTKKTSPKPSYQLPLPERWARIGDWMLKYSPVYYMSAIKEFYTIPITYTRRTHYEINCSFCGCLHTEDGDECGDCVIARNTAVDYTLKWVANTGDVVKLFWLADLIRQYNITRGISIIREEDGDLYIWYIDNTNMWAFTATQCYAFYGFHYYAPKNCFNFKIAEQKRPVNRLDKSWRHTI